MRQFFKFMFASMLGVFLAGILMFFFLIFVISGAISNLSTKEVADVKDNSILRITLNEQIRERSDDNPLRNFDFASFETDKSLGLNDILKSIKKAKNDERIKAILLDVESVDAGIATINTIRTALADFKQSGKPIYAYSETYSQGAYYLASVADKMYLNPEGAIDFKGIGANLMFFKGALDKLEIKPQIIRHGKFKSAVEPFILDKMSPENRIQTTQFLNSIWQSLLTDISTSRKIPMTDLQNAVDNLSGRNAQTALEAKLVDGTVYYDQLLAAMRKITGQTEKQKVNFITLSKYNDVFVKTEDFNAKKIAVIYAAGDIVSGKGDDDQIGSETIAEAIRKARLDSTIKAIVLRVNSPGGSALASDVIWRETVLARKAKPLIVSMGDYAASGGYYISCAADAIVAEPTTITGSIGVFGLMFNAKDMFNNKLGITFDTVKTGRYADIGSTTRPMTSTEAAIIQEDVERIYDSFITHVSEGRKMSKAAVDSIGQGRVWSAIDAKKLGLVDTLGGINLAIGLAAKQAGLADYRTIQLPEKKDFLKKIMEDLNTEARVKSEKENFGPFYEYYRKAKIITRHQGIVALMPLSVELH